MFAVFEPAGFHLNLADVSKSFRILRWPYTMIEIDKVFLTIFVIFEDCQTRYVIL